LLAVGGGLDLTMYGRPVDIEREPYSPRRTIYGLVDRADVADVLVNFDFANPDLPSGRRHETTVPQQALFLMNSPLVVEQARRLVALPEFSSCQDESARVAFLYERIYQRPPRPEEIKLAMEFVAATPPPDQVASEPNDFRPVSNEAPRFRPRPFARQAGRRGGIERRREPLTAWEEYAHALLQANETSFVN
jgi:hypothetical protein